MSIKYDYGAAYFPVYCVEEGFNVYRLQTLSEIERWELRDIEDREMYDREFRRLIVSEIPWKPGYYRLAVDAAPSLALFRGAAETTRMLCSCLCSR